MKHQITLVGGQLLPVFIGIKAFTPDRIHFIVSSESKNRVTFLKSYLNGYTFSEYSCNAHDFHEVKSTCQKILDRMNSEDEVSFNLTGGTKVMVLAIQSLIHEQGLNGFYINQDDTILKLPSYAKVKLNSQITIKEFLELSGHTVSSYKLLNSFSKDDFDVANKIFSFCTSSYRFKAIVTHFSNQYKDVVNMPASGSATVGKMLVTWGKNNISVNDNGKIIFNSSSKNINNLFFNSAWWELLVAKEASTWKKVKELFVQCTLPFKNDGTYMKNEIDVLINIGHKLIFIECKSGKVKHDDINKMRVVKDVYGGIISKSILVCLEMPSATIMEKCKELNIEVFYLFLGKNKLNDLNKLSGILDSFEKKTSI